MKFAHPFLFWFAVLFLLWCVVCSAIMIFQHYFNRPKNMELLREMFVHNVGRGMSIKAACKRTAFWAANDVHDSISTGENLRESLSRLGFRDVDLLVKKINQSDYGDQAREIPEFKFPDQISKNLFFIITEPGGVGGVPTPDCIASNLPKGREPTKEELKAAWEKCAKK